MKKNQHFRATNKKTGKKILFGIEDIMRGDLKKWGLVITIHHSKDEEGNLVNGNHFTEQQYLGDWLRDYDLEYNHNGEWFKYKKNRED